MTSLMMISSVSICTATNQRRPDLISYKAFRKLARQLWLWMAHQQNHPTGHLSVVALPPFFKPLVLPRLDASNFISQILVTFWLYCLESWMMLWRRWYPWLTAGGVLLPTWFFFEVGLRRFGVIFIRYIPLTKDISALAYLVRVLRTPHYLYGLRMISSGVFGSLFPFLAYWTVCFSSAWIFPWNVSGSLSWAFFFRVFPIIMLAPSLSYLRTPYLHLLSWFLLKACCPRYDLTWLRGSCSLWVVFPYLILQIGAGRF